MSPTTDDLRAVLDERAAAAAAAHTPQTALLTGVHARVRRTRRFRTAAVTGVLALVVAGATTAALGGFVRSPDRGLPADPAPSLPSTYLGRPLAGAQTVQATGAAGATEWRLTVGPGMERALVGRCSPTGPTTGTATGTAATSVRVGPRSYPLVCDDAAHTLAEGTVLRATSEAAEPEPSPAVDLGPGLVRVQVSAEATDGPAAVTVGLYDGSATALQEAAPFDPADAQLAVVDVGYSVEEGTVEAADGAKGHLWATVECQDDPAVDQTEYGVSWTVPGAAGPTVLSCTGNGQVNRLEDLSTTFRTAAPVGTITFRVVRKTAGTGQWEQAPRRGPAFKARLGLWSTKGSGPAPTS